MKPLFSIITVCYNSERTIERTIKSIFEQSYLNYEYIIVDGGSTDHTLDIVQKYEPLFMGRMKWKSEHDKGIYDAFNKGIKLANGIYIWIVNSDDYIQENILGRIANNINLYAYDNLPIIVGKMNFRDKEGHIVRVFGSSYQKMMDSYNNYSMGLPHPATIVPQYIYEKHGYYDDNFKIMADNDWFRRIYEAKVKIDFVDMVLTNMCYGGISTVMNFKRFSRERKYFFKMHCKNYFNRQLLFFRWCLYFWMRYAKGTLKSYVCKIF